MAADTIPARLLSRARTQGGSPALHERSGAGWASTSWAEYASEVRLAARALMAEGFEPGQRVCVLGFNSREWVVLDLAAMMAGGVPAGIYETCSSEEVAYILEHSEAPVVLVENADQWRKVNAVRGRLPHLRRIVVYRGVTGLPDPTVLGWQEFLAQGTKVPEAALDARVEALKPHDPATFIYTSGTTGPPKAVMLSHHNLAWTADVANQIVAVGPEDCSVSYLPLSHIAEQMFTLHVPVATGMQVYFARSRDTLKDDLLAARPTVMFGVPRVWEKLHAGLSARLAEGSGVRGAIASWAQGVGRRVAAERNAGREPAGLLAWQYRLADGLVYQKVKAAIGLDRVRVCVSGAAPIASEVLEFFTGLDITVYEVYGQSEGSGPTSFNLPGRTRFGTVGPALPGVEVRIAEDGEILVRGPNVFLGYFKDAQATADTLVDGWLHSGDLGAFDGDGFLTITGRKKEILITAGGKNIAPKNLEASLKNCELVSQAVVIGDRRRFLTALLTLDEAAAGRWAETHRQPATALHQNAALIAELQRAVDATNAQFARVEHVRKFTVLPRDFSTDTGELTPTLKVKRNVVQEKYAREIEAMYAGG